MYGNVGNHFLYISIRYVISKIFSFPHFLSISIFKLERRGGYYQKHPTGSHNLSMKCLQISSKHVMLSSLETVKKLIVTAFFCLFFLFFFPSGWMTEIISSLFLLEPDHHLFEWRNWGLFESNAFGNTYTLLGLSHIFILSYKRLFQVLPENSENLIMSWKLLGISVLIMKILFMELLNTHIKSKKQQPTRWNSSPREEE